MSTPLNPNAPRYAQELDLRARRAEARVEGLEQGLAWLKSYLQSPKFNAANEDGTLDIDAHRVNVDDVLSRLDVAISNSLDYESQVIYR